MSVLDKLINMEKYHINKRKMVLYQDDFIHLLGEDFMDGEITMDPITSSFVFEEEGELYHLTVHKEKNGSLLLLRDPSTGLNYSKVDDRFISNLKVRKKILETFRTKVHVKKEIKALEKFFDHPKVRLKQLFIKNPFLK